MAIPLLPMPALPRCSPSPQLQLSSPFFLRNVAKGQAPVVQVASMCATQSGCALPATPICPYVYKACDGSVVYATAEQPCGPASCPGDSSNNNHQALSIGLCVGLIVPAGLLLIAAVAYAVVKAKQAKQLTVKTVDEVPALTVAGGKPLTPTPAVHAEEPVFVSVGP